jgi:hypothetical protein
MGETRDLAYMHVNFRMKKKKTVTQFEFEENKKLSKDLPKGKTVKS